MLLTGGIASLLTPPQVCALVHPRYACLCASLNMPPPLSSAALPRPSPHQHPLLHADVNHAHHSSVPSSTWSPPSPPPSPSSYYRAPSTSSCAVGPGQHRHAACTLPRVRGPSSYCPSRSSALASAPLAPSRSSSCSQAATCTSRFRSDGVGEWLKVTHPTPSWCVRVGLACACLIRDKVT